MGNVCFVSLLIIADRGVLESHVKHTGEKPQGVVSILSTFGSYSNSCWKVPDVLNNLVLVH